MVRKAGCLWQFWSDIASSHPGGGCRSAGRHAVGALLRPWPPSGTYLLLSFTCRPIFFTAGPMWLNVTGRPARRFDRKAHARLLDGQVGLRLLRHVAGVGSLALSERKPVSSRTGSVGQSTATPGPARPRCSSGDLPEPLSSGLTSHRRQGDVGPRLVPLARLRLSRDSPWRIRPPPSGSVVHRSQLAFGEGLSFGARWIPHLLNPQSQQDPEAWSESVGRGEVCDSA